jgi:hypothetical protein
MKKKASVFFICLALVFGMATGVLAAGNLEAISAYLNHDIKIVYNGQTQSMTDAAGKVIYPISYNGTTYLPVRAVSGLLGVDVTWDGTTSTVYLGKIPGGMDFIENVQPYSGRTEHHVRTAKMSTKTIAGKTYDHYIYGGTGIGVGPVYYDLAGKYKTLTFKAYCTTESTPFATYFWGDNDTLINSFEINGSELPKEYTIDLSGVQRLKLTAGAYTYLFDMIIK